MNRKKSIILISIFAAVLLILAIIIVAISNSLLKKKDNDKLYKIGDVTIRSINSKGELKLENYSYVYDDNVKQKTYAYSGDVTAEILSDYNEYLIIDEGFMIGDEFDGSECGSFSLNKKFEDKKEKLTIEIVYSNNEITLNLILASNIES